MEWLPSGSAILEQILVPQLGPVLLMHSEVHLQCHQFPAPVMNVEVDPEEDLEEDPNEEEDPMEDEDQTRAIEDQVAVPAVELVAEKPPVPRGARPVVIMT